MSRLDEANKRLASIPPRAGMSWLPKSLADVADKPPPPPDIAGVLYAGRVHVLSGEPETGKGWIALYWCKNEVHDYGRVVLYIDHEMDEHQCKERLRVLGASDEALTRFYHVNPSEQITFGMDLVEEFLDEHDPTLIVIDAMTGSLVLHQADPNKASEVETWSQLVARPLRSRGAALLLLDHVTKNADTRGKFAIGSERKIGLADVHLSCIGVQPFGRERTGTSKVIVLKDRLGYLARPTLGSFTLNPKADGERFKWEAAVLDGETHEFRPTFLMEKASRELQRNGPGSRNELVRRISGRKEYILKAVDALVREGYVLEQPAESGRGMTTVVHFKSLFTESADKATRETGTSSEPVPATSSQNGRKPAREQEGNQFEDATGTSSEPVPDPDLTENSPGNRFPPVPGTSSASPRTGSPPLQGGTRSRAQPGRTTQSEPVPDSELISFTSDDYEYWNDNE